ncbi:MAG: TolC family protein, partial [Candidatus Neomarinimicrobiota bacterium]
MEKVFTMKLKYVLPLLLAAGLAAQDNLSLEQAFALALEQNIGIRIARNQTAISENNASIGGAGLLPSINASAGLLNNDFDGYQNNLPVTAVTTKTSTGLSLSYTLFSGLSRVYAFRSLQEQVNSAELQERLTIENTLLGVAQAYFNLAAAGENLAIAEDQLRLSRERRSLSQERMTLGSLGRIDYLSARVDFNADSISFLNTRQTYADASRDLNLLLGREPDRQYTVEPDDSPFTRHSQAELREQALSDNGSLNLTGSTLELSLLNLKSSQSSFLPQINYTASYG